jgi:monoamine oxidase
MQKKPNVLIIGAGMAGLGAAQKLTAENIDVTILEARNRIGGRTWTDHSLGVPMDLGAFIIHGIENNPITELCKRFSARFVLTQFDAFYFANKNIRMQAEQWDLMNEEFFKLVHDAGVYAKSHATDMPLSEAIDHIYDSKIYPELPPGWLSWRSLFLTLYTGADTSALSAKYWDADEIMLGGGNHIMQDGYEPIVKGLAKDLTIKLNHCVTSITYHNDGITVRTQHGLHDADAVIVTLPLGILQRGNVQFEPALPTEKLQSIARLKMGVLDKVILRFPHVFWPGDCHIITDIDVIYPGVRWFLNFENQVQQPMLVGFIGGDTAKALEKKSDAVVKAEIMTKLRGYFGVEVPEPIGFLMTRWSEDLYTQGSYSYIPVGASGKDYDVIGEPLADKVFFAGEATHKHFPGTTHGAYLSGIREAERFIAVLTKQQ